ncbi:hypothetical protein PFDSM3638_07600 [Pyrococcus furiosus DSM 3638]|uniref:Uncharacterized protein n=3 Tax=Pyrococcus furiosus TaxID=2261 RepID=Q8U0S4_PYRFU|nr:MULTISPECIES: hypothetical protein [Pyrococcus]AAL81634.1 hypothetical protein PF1510 [Pyrococcus furiosus DSM 3638]AFN04293.1 hypothetical protein PFC_06785 [Pyrococcus furiosus COM1]MDK2869960.1 hypothetical protein [Pyrococcus sp.]QEK79136.1 hypothetical protein PFDSM3638_07600 [Pyrococcus furiosus DSM 3638]
MKAQLSIDFIFAMTLLLIFSLGLMSFAFEEKEEVETLNHAAKVRVFAISLRDMINKVYAMGPGFAVVKDIPFTLGSKDNVTITVSTERKVTVVAYIEGKKYTVTETLQVPIFENTSVIIENETTKKIVIKYEDGRGVILERANGN